ncbi:hypothetical protein RHAB21_04390 [Pseudorhizobium halotolerans]|uniref:DUF6455 domain-containing protein n=1 Tax=Pseudorhizobium halotolerans TaxID=1233081 RepID=A0ABN7JWU3_9HYPH|nr:DUF6455 family protein [Pseudorhizobium halotolerans]CAD7052043.1 hypothetical protein RHAB21_04390 [Pseudorhizobium halotolerans]
MGIAVRIEKRLERQSSLMGLMMTHLDVDQESAAQERLGLSLARAVRACLFCRHGNACEAWLSSNAQAREGVAPGFCTNRDFFRAHS